VSELSIRLLRASISCILHRELASVLLRFKNLKLAVASRIFLLSAVKGIYYSTYKIEFLTELSWI